MRNEPLESRVLRKEPARFGGGPTEKERQRHLAGGLPYHVWSIAMARDRNGTDTPGASQRVVLESELHRLWSSKPWCHPPIWANPSRYPALAVSHMRQHLCRNDRHRLLWSASCSGNDRGMSGPAGRTQQPGGHSARQRHQRRDRHGLVTPGSRSCRTHRGALADQLPAHPGPTRRHVDLCRPHGRKRGRSEQDERGTFWRGITIARDARMRVGRAIAKTAEQVADTLLAQLKARGHGDAPPPMATAGTGGYRAAMLATWGQVPA